MKPRDNPFRADRLDTLPYLFQDHSATELLRSLEQLGNRASIVGLHGRGKTCLLDELGAGLAMQGWNIRRLRLNSQVRNFSLEVWRGVLPSLETNDFVLLDGAEQLSYWRWRQFLRLTRRAGGVLVTAHRSGILPTLHECLSSVQILQQLIEALAPGQECATGALAQVLYDRHDGNLREALRELYDLQTTKNEGARESAFVSSNVATSTVNL